VASNSIKTFKITCAASNTAYNVLSGTTSAPTTANASNYANKGVAITFQCQTNGAVGKAGGSDVVTNAGITFSGTAPQAPYSPSHSSISSVSYQVADWWVSADTNDTVIVVQLIKHV
jgi:hypothetical protein